MAVFEKGTIAKSRIVANNIALRMTIERWGALMSVASIKESQIIKGF